MQPSPARPRPGAREAQASEARPRTARGGASADQAGAPAGRAPAAPGRHAPLAVLGHLDGPPSGHGRAAVRHAEHLHGLALRPPLAMAVQHWRVHALPRRVCEQTGVRARQPGAWRAAQGLPGPRTYFVPGGQVLVLVARVPLFPVQEEEIDHLLLVLPAGGPRGVGDHGRGRGPCTPAPWAPAPPGTRTGRTPRTAGPAAACCGRGSSPASACCPARRGRCPPGWAASGSVPCGGWAAPAPARSCPRCGRQGAATVTPLGPAGGPPTPPALAVAREPAVLLCPALHTPVSCPGPARLARGPRKLGELGRG